MELIRYDNACRAVAEAKRIDEVREIVNRAEALRAYAKIAKNRQLELDAIEIRVRGERRQGELIIDARKHRQVAVQGTRDFRGEDDTLRTVPRLREIGIGHKESIKSQRLAMLADNRFERGIAEWRDGAQEAKGNIPLPLREYLQPSRKRAASPKTIDLKDPLDAYRAPDGRRVADWCAGELDRLSGIFERAVRCVNALRAAMPIANPQPFDTMEFIFEREALADILKSLWEAGLEPGVDHAIHMALKKSSHRKCPACKSVFFARSVARGRPKLFCSDSCRESARKSGRYDS